MPSKAHEVGVRPGAAILLSKKFTYYDTLNGEICDDNLAEKEMRKFLISCHVSRVPNSEMVDGCFQEQFILASAHYGQ